ncbi:Oidioi.mRNA.OKI2018_I69.chr2.g4955.t1.cds [Oikopleura dioica]|uniref:polynucleotide adenylyltransferase n=1 Tax=Oikopleura dioica TaxID=34765 RepID=A0ABN7T832_OIKDI|nr:Oidioi.mRNA.OKI2018_I69.chr2.g4955.t1.cds [Oikopleura dioica]
MSNGTAKLKFGEIKKLQKILDKSHEIHGKGNFPTIEVEPTALIKDIHAKLGEAGITVAHVKLNGSCASHIISHDDDIGFKDIDIIFNLASTIDHPARDRLNESTTCRTIKKRKRTKEEEQRWTTVRDTVMSVLLSYLPKDIRRDRLTTDIMVSAYVNKLIKISNETDKWSLISLSNENGRNLELKFVESMRRQFEFSVDSFQITLDSYLTYTSVTDKMDASFFPLIEVESVFGSFEEARSHLINRKIVTRSPEEIRGGGLLRYCNLLTRDFTVEEPADVQKLQSIMCSRFFIDFPEIETQTRKIKSYLAAHFNSDDELSLRFNFMLSLQAVVNDSTICLMSQERQEVLNLIMSLAQQTLSDILIQEGFTVQFPIPEPPQYVPVSTHVIAHVTTQDVAELVSDPSSSGLSSINSDDLDLVNDLSRPCSISSVTSESSGIVMSASYSNYSSPSPVEEKQKLLSEECSAEVSPKVQISEKMTCPASSQSQTRPVQVAPAISQN